MSASASSRNGASIVRERDAQATVCGFFVGAFVLAVALADGGYFPEAWNWAAAGALAAAAAAFAGYDRVEVAPRTLLFVGVLAVFACWSVASLAWTISTNATATEAQRAVAYVAVAAGASVVIQRRHVAAAAGGALAAIVVVVGAALWSGLLGDERTADRLAGAVGYWNGLGFLAAVGVVLSTALGARAEDRRARAVALAPAPLLGSALVLTYSRSAWIALAVGATLLTILVRERRRLLAVGLVESAGMAAAILLTVRVEGIVGSASPYRGGSLLAFALVVLAILTAWASGRVSAVERLLAPIALPARARLPLLLAIAVGAIAVAVHAAPSAYDAFTGDVPTGSLRNRLTSFSGNGRSEYWRVAWMNWRAHPWLGSGAGTYELAWDRERRVRFDARDAHNLYLEAASELGPLGVLMLVSAFGVVLVSVRRTDDEAVAAGAAVVAAFAATAVVDWDWELPAAAVPALFCAAIALNGGAERQRPLGRRFAIAAAAAVLPMLALYVGNHALQSAYRAEGRRADATARRDARRAERWQPWSIEPALVLGQLDLAEGDRSAALRRFRAAAADEPNDWRPWQGIFVAARGAEAAAARRRAHALNPRSVS